MVKFQSKIGREEISNWAKAMLAGKCPTVAIMDVECENCGKIKKTGFQTILSMEVGHASKVVFQLCDKCWDIVNLKVHEETAAIEKRAEEDKRKITYLPFLATKRYTPEQLQNHIIYDLEHAIERYDKEIFEFTEAFKKDAAYALKWSSHSFKLAAVRKVAMIMLEILKDPASNLDRAVQYAHDQMVSGARWPEHSTSPSSNLMHQEMTSAWAEMVVKLTYNPSEKEA